MSWAMFPKQWRPKKKIALDIESGPVDEMIEAIKVTYGTGIVGKRIGMKKVPCDAPQCADRRVHYNRPDEEPRGTQYCEVKANHTGPAFCSLNCYFKWKGTLKEKENVSSD